MDDIDAFERGEIRSKPTTAQDAFDIYKRDQDVRGQAKSNNYKANNNSIYRILKAFVKHFGPNRRYETVRKLICESSIKFSVFVLSFARIPRAHT
jgi:hypothetical protein